MPFTRSSSIRILAAEKLETRLLLAGDLGGGGKSEPTGTNNHSDGQTSQDAPVAEQHHSEQSIHATSQLSNNEQNQEQSTEQNQNQQQRQFAHALRVQDANKLARDVYMAVAALWKKSLFKNAAAAESSHLTQFNDLMLRSGLDQSPGNDAPGAFANQEFSRRYAEFTQRAATSLHEAFQVAWEVEEIRIADIELQLGQDMPVEFRSQYQDLIRTSHSHVLAIATHMEAMTGQPLESELHPTVVRDAVLAEFAAGDANRDLQFDQHDIIQVLQAGLYGSGRRASWTQGDWNDDGLFNQRDVIAAFLSDRYAD